MENQFLVKETRATMQSLIVIRCNQKEKIF